jgi:LL-diaminopimelate aminotransferase
MTKRNPFFDAVHPSYLFQDIAKRVRIYREKNPDQKLIHLGVGDTTEPLPPCIAESLSSFSKNLGSASGYRGYGMEQGDFSLRECIAKIFYHEKISPQEIFISDGAKCDIGRLQILFGKNASIAVQDPAYPVYVDTGLLLGQNTIHFLPCTPENHFFPDTFPSCDLIYFCSPNNPTGAAATFDQLRRLVSQAKEHHSIIIYDAAYASFIRDPHLPRSIYEIEGAGEVAIEVSSFSKLAGFSGIRLGWTVVPLSLAYDNGKSVHPDWNRIVTTFFNGASCIAQAGGAAALTPEGQSAIAKITDYYLENAAILRRAMRNFPVYGGENTPYLWVHTKKNSWEMFQNLLESCQIVSTPGSGFGAKGEGFLRISAFGSRDKIVEGAKRLHSFNNDSIDYSH